MYIGKPRLANLGKDSQIWKPWNPNGRPAAAGWDLGLRDDPWGASPPLSTQSIRVNAGLVR